LGKGGDKVKVKIQSIADRGVPDKERIVMNVLSDTDIGGYAIFEASFRDGTVTTGVYDVFWFPDKQVNVGDYVVLYTKSGTQSEKTLKNGKKSHFFYWGSAGTKWDTKRSAPVLLLISEWSAFLP
jgi:hypothetical protein